MRDIDLWRIHSLGASIALAEGRTDEARRLADLAFDEGRDAWNDTAVGIHTHVMSSADRIDGQPERARDRLTALEEAVGGPVLRLLVAWVDAEAGHADRAAGALGRIGVDRIRALPELFLGTIGLAAAAGTACALRDRSWMRVVYETMLPLEEQICGLPWAPLPAAAHFLGQLAAGLGDPSAADRHHDIAELVHGRFLAPGFSAYAEEHRSSARA